MPAREYSRTRTRCRWVARCCRTRAARPWRRPDVVLLVGSEAGMGDSFLPKLEIAGDIVRIDIDPTELTSVYAAAVPILADARGALSALAAALSTRTPVSRRSQGETRAKDIRERNAAKMTDLEKLHARVWKILRAALPADGIVMGECFSNSV